MADNDTLHKRKFTLTVEFTDEEREDFFSQMQCELGDSGISSLIIAEVMSCLKYDGLRPTVERIH